MLSAACKQYISFFAIIYIVSMLSAEQTYAYAAQDDSYYLQMHLDTNPEYNQQYNTQQNGLPAGGASNNTSLNTSNINQSKDKEIVTGFGDSVTDKGLGIEISTDSVSYGPLSPTDFITRNSTITISGDTNTQYNLLAFMDHELSDKDGHKIPNTICDDGGCNENKSSAWINPLTFGFGYHCNNREGSDCISNQTDTNFQQFPMGSDIVDATTLAEGITSTDKQLDLLYKINVPATQAHGVYTNQITFIAVPLY